jgi:hypothetical protein
MKFTSGFKAKITFYQQKKTIIMVVVTQPAADISLVNYLL